MIKAIDTTKLMAWFKEREDVMGSAAIPLLQKHLDELPTVCTCISPIIEFFPSGQCMSCKLPIKEKKVREKNPIWKCKCGYETNNSFDWSIHADGCTIEKISK